MITENDFLVFTASVSIVKQSVLNCMIINYSRNVF